MRTKKNVWTRRLVIIAAACAGVVALSAGPSIAAPARHTHSAVATDGQWTRSVVTALTDGQWT
jgi:hypothetical protein